MSVTNDGFLIPNSVIETKYPGLILFQKMNECIPIATRFGEEAIQFLHEKENVSISPDQTYQIIDLAYQPVPGIFCQIEIEELLVNTSILHLLFSKSLPFYDEIVEYQNYLANELVLLRNSK